MDLPDLKHKKIGVLMGGLSGEREVSLRSGANCLRALLSKGYDAVPMDAIRDVAQCLDEQQIEVAFLALHGRYGEDGTIQGLLEIMGIPYTGSGVLASALGMNKVAAKKVVAGSGLQTPAYSEVDEDEPTAAAAERIEAELSLPVMLKPVEEGSSLGVAKCGDRATLRSSIETARADYGAVFAECFVSGREITVGVLEQQEGLQVLPILELVPKNEFYDYQAKYTPGLTEFHVPARLPGAVYRKVQETAVLAHRVLGCHGWSRVDAIVDRAGTPFVLEVNTLPGMTNLSDLPAEAQAEDMSYDQLVLEILDSALTRNI
jgi:D-alanine-D-alanine ligase